jgi:glucose/arabinose dehydrogenase
MKIDRTFTATAALVSLALAVSHAQADTCGPWPRLQAQTVAGWCLGQVTNADVVLKMPRSIVWLSSTAEQHSFLVVDMGGWEPGKGKLLLLTVSANGKTQTVKQLLTALDRPHGFQRGPDGLYYLAEASRISRFAWNAAQPVTLQTVVDELPAEGRHPLKEFVFGSDKNLYINVGAGTDRCTGTDSRLLPAKNGVPQCSEMQGTQPQAAIYKAQMRWPAGQLESISTYALGLRNSMALAAHSSGTLWQAENNIDDPQENFPAEEINQLKAGAHYGWPSCVENRTPMAGVTAANCAKTTAPVQLIPAHAAPLHMQYSNTMFATGAGTSAQGLLVGLHGYRASGQRIVRYNVSADGTPTGKPLELVHHWQASTQAETTKPGAPVGWAEDDKGNLWIADDRNHMIVWFGKPLPDAKP